MEGKGEGKGSEWVCEVILLERNDLSYSESKLIVENTIQVSEMENCRLERISPDFVTVALASGTDDLDSQHTELKIYVQLPLSEKWMQYLHTQLCHFHRHFHHNTELIVQPHIHDFTHRSSLTD